MIPKSRRATGLLAGLFLAATLSEPLGADTEPLERLQDTARAFLAQLLATDGAAETRIEIGPLDNRLRLVRCNRAPIAQLAPGARTDGNTSVNIRCSDPVRWSIFVPVRVERYTQVVVVARPLSREQVIRPGDLGLERMETSKLAKGYFIDMEPLVGLEARRRLIPGQVLTSAQVAKRQLVKRGQQVILFSTRPGLSVRMKGKALEDGTEGQRIRVRNGSSKRIVEGYVEASGAIRVAL